ncbi:MAG: hypothetical protein FWE90_01480 [Defluviitaleaceae bacterium]|nr:hypothetical protein [Defluviitaleaceae bacterium]
MQCRTHPTAHAVNTCNTCGEWLCEVCTLDINGRLFCRACLAKLAEYEAAPEPARKCAPPMGRRIRWSLTFIFSFLPGANYMYLGLIKRGLAAMCGFFLLIYLLTLVAGSFLGGPLTVLLSLSLPVCYLTYTFDGFNIRRRMLSGETVHDNIDDVIAFFRRNKKTLLILFILCIGLGAAGSLLNAILKPLFNLVPLLLIGFCVYAVLKKKT